MKTLSLLWLALLLSSCAVKGKGILLSVEPATPLDERDLQNHCDLGDQAACALNAQEESATKPSPKFAIVQGVAVPDRAVFAALLPADSAISWFIYDRELNRLWKLHDNRKQKRPGSGWYVQRVEARELEPDRNYELLAGDKDGNLVEDRIFRTLPQEGKFRFGVISGLANVSKHQADQLLLAAQKKDPALLIFSGGNVNAIMSKENIPKKRTAALDFFFERHISARNEMVLARERRLIPVAATWNDREFGLAGGNRTFAFKDQAREVFEMFFPVWADETTIVNGPGVSKIFRLGSQSFVLLDERSFRVPDGTLPPCEASPKKRKGNKTANCSALPAPEPGPLLRFGSMQSEWAFRQAHRTQQVVWLVSAEPWLGLYQALSQKPASYTEWFSQLSARPSAPSLSLANRVTIVEKSKERQISLTPIDGAGISYPNVEISLP